MAEAWLPGAARLQVEEEDGGDLKGGAPRVVWHTTGADPHLVSARSAAQCLQQEGHSAHLVWNPLSGEIVQMAPATRAARTLDSEAVHEGRVCIHIAVVGHPGEPFTSGRLRGLDAILAWLDSWRIARRWPAGPPLSSPQSYNSPRSRRMWARGGHFGASQVPEAGAAGPGQIDICKITGPHTPRVGIPRPRVGTVRPSGRQPAVPQHGGRGEHDGEVGLGTARLPNSEQAAPASSRA